jgi:subtilase family serine protease
MSYGGCEAQNSSSIRSLAQQAAAEGITWVASSGDSGAAACDSASASTATHGLAVNIPASFPEVTAVGGTTFAEGSGSYWSTTQASNGGSATSYIPETAWNDTPRRNQLTGTGGGASIYYAKPSWQSAPGVPADGMRDVPDLAFTASADHDGYLVVINGTLSIVGGTSAPTPAFAGVLGLLNQYLLKNGKITQAGLGNINPTLYHLAQTTGSVFHDITSGSNIVPCTVGTPNCTTGSLGYSATAGYDRVTGLGSADINNMFANWSSLVSSTGTTTALSANPSTILSTASTVLTARVSPSSGTAAPSGTVSFTTGSKSLGSAALTASGLSSTGALSVPASSLVSGANAIVATYSGSTSFGGSSGSAIVTVTPASSGSNVVPSVNPNPVTRTGTTWNFTLTLTEKAGVGTTLTGFTINTADYSAAIRTFFGTTQIAANGSIATTLHLSGLTPQTIVFGFKGTDTSGRTWTASIPVPFQ